MEDIRSIPLLRLLQLIFAGFSLFLLVFLILLLALPQFFSGVPAVAMDNSSAGAPPIVVTRSFNAGNGTETITVAVNGSVYAASKKTFRTTLLFGDQRVSAPRYYGAMIYDPSQEGIYRDLIARFREIRAARNLSDDEYLELIASYAQSITYKDGGETPPKYPAELLAENAGDCDDKSILIAGLLAREGYSVALLKFGPERHMTVGIGSDAFPYRSTGYTYLEGMTPAYTGVKTAHLLIPLTSDPFVIPIRSGTKIYHSGNETRAIMAAFEEAKRREAALADQLAAAPGPDTNMTNVAFREDQARYRMIQRYILSHPYDRPGTYAYVMREGSDLFERPT
jgi:hypothetical protein